MMIVAAVLAIAAAPALAAQVPGAPRSVTATAGNGRAVITWSAPVTNGGAVITRYTARTAEGTHSCTWTGGPLTCTLLGLANGSQFTVTVTASNTVGVSAASSPVAVKPIGPPRPMQAPTVRSNNASIDVEWGFVSSDGTPITGFVATATPSGHSCSTNASATRCTITGLKNDTAFTVVLVATSAAGPTQSPPSASVITSALPDPAIVQVLRVGNASVQVDIGRPRDHGATITGYTVTSTPDSRTCTSNDTERSCVVGGLRNDVAYCFRVTVQSSAGTTPADRCNGPATPLPFPESPLDVTVDSVGDGSATVRWSPPRSNGGAVITTYTAVASKLVDGQERSCTWTGGPLTCTVTGLTNGEGYTFAVRATNRAGTSPLSTQSAVARPVVYDTAPRNLSAIIGSGSIVVAWNPPSGTGGLGPITGYVVTATPSGRSCTWTGGPLTCTITGITNGSPQGITVAATTASGTGRAASLGPATKISVGGDTTCVTVSTGGVKCWGDNGFGQFGDGTASSPVAPVSTPSDVSAVSGSTSIATGGNRTCAVLADTTVRCWGEATFGALGNGDNQFLRPQFTPVTVTGVTGATAVSMGSLHSCALLASGSVRCWGRVFIQGTNCLGGSTGTGALVQRGCFELGHSGPTVVGVSGATAISSGGQHSCAILADRTVTCWGALSLRSSVGLPFRDVDVAVPVPDLHDVTALASQGSRTCALIADGTVRCFSVLAGSIQGTSFVPGPEIPYTELVTVPGLIDATATSTRCAVRSGGGLVCWDLTPSATPVAVSGLRDVTAVADGAHHQCVILAGGTVKCWGLNNLGQLGDGTTTSSTTPVATRGFGALTPFTVPSAPSAPHVISIRSGTAIVGWSAPVFDGGSPITSYIVATTLSGPGCTQAFLGTLSCMISGLPDDPNITFTVRAVNAAGIGPASEAVGGAVALASGDAHSCALMATGSVRCWGANTRGQLGAGTTDRLTGRVEVSGLDAVIGLALGSAHSCALKSDRTVVCWGANGAGQLGDGTTTDRSTPVAVIGLSDVESIALGANHSCARLRAGTVMCWGANTAGQLGDGTTTARNRPTEVTGLQDVTSLAAGFRETCAVRSNGAVRCWGANGSGQLGDGTRTNRSSSVRVAGVDGASAVSIGSSHACATLTTGEVMCWGANGAGQLGDGTTTARPNAAVVSGLHGVASTRSGTSHTCALRLDSSVTCWGADDRGQIGDGGTAVARTTPIDVPSLTTAVEISTGSLFSCARRINGQVLCWGANGTGQLGDGTTDDRSSPVRVLF